MIKKAITTALLCSAILADAGAATINFTYAGKDYFSWGTGKKENYDVAMRIDNPELVGKKITKISASLYATEGISGTTMWMTKELSLNDKKQNVPDITSVEVAPSEYGDMKVTLESPYTITSDGVYIGYSFTIDELNDETKTPLLLAEKAHENGFYLHSSRTVLKWMNYGTSRVDASPIIEVTIEGDFPEYSMSLTSLPVIYGKAGATATVNVGVQNVGSEPVNEIEYTYTIDGNTKTGKQTLTAPIASDYVHSTVAPLVFEVPEAIGEYDIEVKIDKINGTVNSSSSATASGKFNAVAIVPHHRPLVEEYTGTWCGWCPRGWYVLEKMNRLYGSDFIGIAYHNGDPMATVSPSDYPVYVNGFPAATVDRGSVIDPDEAEEPWKISREQFTPAAISLYAWWTDKEKTSIEAASFTKFAIAEENADYRLAYVLCADDLHSTDSDWDQSNYFPGYRSDYEGTELEVLCDMGNPIKDLHFNEVALIADTPDGIDGSLPSSIETDKTTEDHYTFDTKPVKNLIQNPDKLFVVAIVLDGKTGKVVNAIKAPVTAEAGVDTAIAEEAKDAVSVRYTDLQGRIVKAPRAGIYIKTVKYSDGSVKSEKELIK